MDDFIPEVEKVYYSSKNWVELPDYYIYVDKTKTSKDGLTIGEMQSKKCRVTGSIVNKCINNYSDKVLVARQIAGLYKEDMTQESRDRINHGIEHEQDARNWYTSATGYTIKPSIFGVYKKDYRLGAEHDGFVCDKDGNELDGIIEIKCPLKMYESIKTFLNGNNTIESDNSAPPSHITESHYDQMQMEMEIFNKSWCDYIVFCLNENKVYLTRVFRNKKHWNIMYEKIQIFLDAKLSPLLKEIQSDYPYNPAFKNR